MPGPNVGHAEIQVDFDGRRLPAEAKALGEEAGVEGGRAYGDASDKEIRDRFADTQKNIVKDAESSGRFKAAGKAGGASFGKSFDDALQGLVRKDLDKLATDIAGIFHNPDGLNQFAANLKDVDGEFNRVAVTGAKVRENLRQLDSAGLLAEGQFEKLAAATRDWETEARVSARSAETARLGMQRLSSSYVDLNKEIDIARTNLGKSIDLNFDQAIHNVDKLADSFDLLHREYTTRDIDAFGGSTRSVAIDLDKLGLAVDNAGKKTESAAPRVRGLFGVFDGAVSKIAGIPERILSIGNNSRDAGNKAGGAAPKFGELFKAFSNFDPGDNLGQLLLLIIAFLPQITVLASSAAAGLVILGGAVTALGLGAAGLGITFSNVTGPLKALPADARPAAAAIQDLFGKTEKLNGRLQTVPGAIAGLRAALQGSALDGLAKPIRELTESLIPSLEGDLKVLGGSLNVVLQSWLADVNSSGFRSTIEGIFTGLAPSIENLGQIASNVFGIIGQLLLDTTGDVNELTGGIADATGDFLTFLKSPTGHKEVHDWIEDAKRVLGTLGDELGGVAAALGDLLTPKNIQDTITSLHNLGDAAKELVGLSNELGTLAVTTVQVINAVAGVAEVVGGVFNSFFDAVDGTVLDLGLAFTQLNSLIGAFIGGVATNFANLGQIIRDGLTGNIGAIPGDINKFVADSKSGLDNLKNAIKGAVGDSSAEFTQFSAATQASLNQVASNLNITGSKADDFKVKLAVLADASGVSLQKLASDTSLHELAVDLGTTDESVKKMFGDIFNNAPKGSAALAALQGAAASNLDSVVGKLGATGKAASTLETAFQKSAGTSRSALSGLASAKSYGDIQAALGGAGAAAKTRLANNIVAAAAQSGTAINSLPPKIQALIAKYAQIPRNKSTSVTVTGVSTGISLVNQLIGKLGSLQNKTVVATVINKQVQSGAAGAVGGIFDNDGFIVGGRRRMAAGGILRNPTLLAGGSVLAGEAGPEAIVPLTGALANVDQSVRGLAAAARGVGQGNGRTLIIEAGAIQINTPAADGRIVATQVLDRLLPLGGF
jgi:hypothetical protein